MKMKLEKKSILISENWSMKLDCRATLKRYKFVLKTNTLKIVEMKHEKWKIYINFFMNNERPRPRAAALQ